MCEGYSQNARPDLPTTFFGPLILRMPSPLGLGFLPTDFVSFLKRSALCYLLAMCCDDPATHENLMCITLACAIGPSMNLLSNLLKLKLKFLLNFQ